MVFLNFLSEFGLHQSAEFAVNNKGNIHESIIAAKRLDILAVDFVVFDQKYLNFSSVLHTSNYSKHSKKHPQKCDSRFFKVHQVSRRFISKTPGYLMNCQYDYVIIVLRRSCFKKEAILPAYLRKKTSDFQFSPIMCYDNGALAVLSALTAVSAKSPAILQK